MPARAADKAALLSLWTLFNGSEWHNTLGWDPGGVSDPCLHRWYGVGCEDPCDLYLDGEECYYGRIVSINLANNNLTGRLSDWTAIGALHNLSYLDLSYNHLHGEIPSAIADTSLEYLDLKFNQLEGTLPQGFSNTSLDTLAVEYNQISGTLPSELGLQTRLKMLHVGRNRLSGSIPSQLSNLTELQVLNLASMSLDGPLPGTIGQMASLRYLNVSNNEIDGTLPRSFGGLENARDLILDNNRISGSLPTEIGMATELRRLILHDNYLSGNLTAVHTLDRLVRLEWLDLYNNSMVGDVPALDGLTSIKHLYVDLQHVSGLLAKAFCKRRFSMNPDDGFSSGWRYNWRVVVEMYPKLSRPGEECPAAFDKEFAFGTLKQSGRYLGEVHAGGSVDAVGDIGSGEGSGVASGE